MRNQLDRALNKNPGYPPGCSPRDVDGSAFESQRLDFTAETQRRGEDKKIATDEGGFTQIKEND
jgi:hypothetical protein